VKDNTGAVTDVTGVVGELVKFVIAGLNDNDTSGVIEYEPHYTLLDTVGSRATDGTWNGAMGEVVAGNADLIAAFMVATGERSRAVGFTPPFASSGYSMMRAASTTKEDIWKWIKP